MGDYRATGAGGKSSVSKGGLNILSSKPILGSSVGLTGMNQRGVCSKQQTDQCMAINGNIGMRIDGCRNVTNPFHCCNDFCRARMFCGEVNVQGENGLRADSGRYTEGKDESSECRDASRGTGIVIWFNRQKGCGFISPEGGGSDLYVHHSVIDAEGFRSRTEGDVVKFLVEKSRDGCLRAAYVTGLTRDCEQAFYVRIS